MLLKARFDWACSWTASSHKNVWLYNWQYSYIYIYLFLHLFIYFTFSILISIPKGESLGLLWFAYVDVKRCKHGGGLAWLTAGAFSILPFTNLEIKFQCINQVSWCWIHAKMLFNFSCKYIQSDNCWYTWFHCDFDRPFLIKSNESCLANLTFQNISDCHNLCRIWHFINYFHISFFSWLNWINDKEIYDLNWVYYFNKYKRKSLMYIKIYLPALKITK